MDRNRVLVFSRAFLAVLVAGLSRVPRTDAQIQVAGDLYVELDAADPSAGTDLWINTAPESIGVGSCRWGCLGVALMELLN